MLSKSPAVSLTSWLWGSLTSIRLTVILLLTLALVATLGTVIPQGEAPARYLESFGPKLGYFLWRFGFARIYDSPWFLLPVALLALNLLCCVWRGLPQAVRRVSRPLDWKAAQDLPERGRFAVPAGVDPEKFLEPALNQELGRTRRVDLGGKTAYLYQTGRFRPLGPYLIHMSLLLIVSGGLVGKFWGVDGRLLLKEGEAATAFQPTQGPEAIPLGFEVRLSRFLVNFYESGVPSEFRSDLVIFQDGKEALATACRVNEPVTFGGLTLYQSSYGSQPAGPVRLKVCRGPDCHNLEASVRQGLALPGGQAQMMVVRVDANLQGMGPAVQVALKTGPSHPHVFWVSQNHPELAGRQDSPFWQPGDYRISVEAVPVRYYSVFQVRRDPGVWWVYSGFLLCLPGFFLAFLRPAQRWAIVLTPKAKGGFDGRILGVSPRAREVFAQRLERLLARLKEKS